MTPYFMFGVMVVAGLTLSCRQGIEPVINAPNAIDAAKVEEVDEVLPQVSRSPTKIQDIDLRIGIADISYDGNSCLRTKNPSLAAGTPITIIFSLNEAPQKVVYATVVKISAVSCARRASEDGDSNKGKNYFYSLALAGGNTRELEEMAFDVGIGLIAPADGVQMHDGQASIDLDNDGKREHFRRCTSFEGLHFTIWKGKPLKGKRIWHTGYYLDYGTVADCRKKDWEGTDDDK